MSAWLTRLMPIDTIRPTSRSVDPRTCAVSTPAPAPSRPRGLRCLRTPRVSVVTGLSPWHDSFHVSMTRVPRSQPRMPIVAVRARKCARRGRQPQPARGQDPQDRWPCANSRQSPSTDGSRQRAMTRSARAPTWSSGLAARPRPGPDRPVRDSRVRMSAVVRPSRLAVVPLPEVVVRDRAWRSRRAARSRPRARAGWSAPARTGGGRAAGRGRGPARRPRSVSGMSVLPVCCPDLDHSVSPWRTR